MYFSPRGGRKVPKETPLEGETQVSPSSLPFPLCARRFAPDCAFMSPFLPVSASILGKKFPFH